VRLACVKHAASVRSEPGSNSQVHPARNQYQLKARTSLQTKRKPKLTYSRRTSNKTQSTPIQSVSVRIQSKKYISKRFRSQRSDIKAQAIRPNPNRPSSRFHPQSQNPKNRTSPRKSPRRNQKRHQRIPSQPIQLSNNKTNHTQHQPTKTAPFPVPHQPTPNA
jgi:hypothetical protein